MKKLITILALTFSLVACGPLETKARDTAAALNGSLTSAQAQYEAQCKVDPTQKPCVLINKGISAQNALITATQTYCGWSATNAPPDPAAKCIPVKDAAGALNAAIANAAQLTTEIRQTVTQ